MLILSHSTSASASGSPAGQQKGINDFFSVTGILSSSPQKCAQPCSSTFTDELNRELFPQERPIIEEEEEEDDDVSLLAVALVLDPEWKEDVDDASLLAAASVQEHGTPKEEEVDYLEGMTSEMFGDDDQFERCNTGIQSEQEEVEALPDAHYGLLGSSKVLLNPQGSMDDLPEEVLRQVLCLLPAQDLYRNAGLVCHRWRNIVEDTKVKPTPKLLSHMLARESVKLGHYDNYGYLHNAKMSCYMKRSVSHLRRFSTSPVLRWCLC